MSDQKQERTEASNSAERKPEWVRPDFSRLEAGAADAADINNTDGTFTS